ncbi:hypothetical protein NEPAR06_2233 [Nematocida parisii]|uniref:Uncharacterized protein n=1 Tax=Nematocida parisii (strain ERTm3) TaxID=935791 RepID=I3EKK0_NEMP3|nr:uncharacterized protein NEPG_00715 [Nematocida parisii ERTm1]EIJ89747.1 hypothetical protein NEQG_00517 [Nematocida parisii ERTm3]KAI5131004.1 hypothetical protein NEPAR03_2275 [Nematocida parisii]EIJ94050.1 hypothetical protein NEPG_00715 [Nematocida parisii ERTm1]KAI5131016.1 hypothetical protein NEPAR08_2310 [Nematocida parisii]KAI5141228.1 hypothetical protein NEPAR04_0798 [Nematocida parisii]|eukprot:XP_013058546.1 hypothetical protein NEPG_00715 [Nematocida parisii ERTm1]
MREAVKREELLTEIKTLPISQIKKNKSALIGRIIQGKFNELEQIELRRELQKRFINDLERKDKQESEMEKAESEIKKQCDVSVQASKKLAESDGKLSKIKRSQERISEEMKKAESTLQKKKSKEMREEFLFIGAFGVFFSICSYILIDKFVLQRI